MSTLREFKKACPIGLCLHDRPCQNQAYKYYACGKGCCLGILFEDSVNVYFEWLTEDEQPVDYSPEIRYKAWPKRELSRLVAEGVWDVTSETQLVG